MNAFVAEDNNNFPKLKEYFQTSALIFQYAYSSLFPKCFCRVGDYDIKNKLAFEVAHAAYQNQQKAIVQLLEPQQQQQQQQQIVKIKQEQIDDDDKKAEVVKEKTTSTSVKPTKKERQKMLTKINFF